MKSDCIAIGDSEGFCSDRNPTIVLIASLNRGERSMSVRPQILKSIMPAIPFLILLRQSLVQQGTAQGITREWAGKKGVGQ
jgi:hypothetical protein